VAQLFDVMSCLLIVFIQRFHRLAKYISHLSLCNKPFPNAMPLKSYLTPYLRCRVKIQLSDLANSCSRHQVARRSIHKSLRGRAVFAVIINFGAYKTYYLQCLSNKNEPALFGPCFRCAITFLAIVSLNQRSRGCGSVATSKSNFETA